MRNESAHSFGNHPARHLWTLRWLCPYTCSIAVCSDISRESLPHAAATAPCSVPEFSVNPLPSTTVDDSQPLQATPHAWLLRAEMCTY